MNTVIHQTPDAPGFAPGTSPDPAARTPGLDALVRSLGQAREQTGTAAHELAESAANVAHESLDAARRRAIRLGDQGAGYVREHPLQSVLIAAGTGAAVALLVRALMRSR